jgi:uncharacterized protein (TIGR01777 family)
MSTSKKILITGASGLIGTRLTELLQLRGDIVVHLGRSSRPSSTAPSFVWNVREQSLDAAALEGVDAIVHLAGANVAEGRWTPKRKKEILESRTKSTALLAKTLRSQPHRVKCFVSASGIGYYGYAGPETVFTEERGQGSDFLAQVTAAWEHEADQVASADIRLVKLRIGVALSNRGGALKELSAPVRWGVGAPLGSGKQLMSWIHLDDLCRIFIKAIDDQAMRGAYNAVAPNPVTNRALTRAIGRTLHRPVFLPPVPGFALRIVLGEMADVVLNGSAVSGEKITKAGYAFQFTSIDTALKDLLKPVDS